MPPTTQISSWKPEARGASRPSNNPPTSRRYSLSTTCLDRTHLLSFISAGTTPGLSLGLPMSPCSLLRLDPVSLLRAIPTPVLPHRAAGVSLASHTPGRRIPMLKIFLKSRTSLLIPLCPQPSFTLVQPQVLSLLPPHRTVSGQKSSEGV